MTFQWEVRDGYGGKSRPQYTTVDDSELLECDTIDEALQVIEDAIRDDFDQSIAPDWNEEDFRKQMKKLFVDKGR